MNLFGKCLDHTIVTKYKNDKGVVGATALIIGGMKYMGKLLLCKLQEKGYIVKVYDYDDEASKEANEVKEENAENKSNEWEKCSSTLAAFYEERNVEVIHGSLTDLDRLTSACENVCYVFVLVQESLRASMPKSELSEISVYGTSNIIDASVKQKVKVLVYWSLCNVVFDYSKGVYDASEDLPYSKSGDAKTVSIAKAESLILNANNKGGVLKTIALRTHLLYGDNGFNACGEADYLLSKLKEKANSFLLGNEGTLTDLTHVDNAVHAHILAAELLGGVRVFELDNMNEALEGERRSHIAGKAYNIVNDEKVRYWAFLSNLAGELGFQRPYIHLPCYIVYFFSFILFNFFGKILPKLFCGYLFDRLDFLTLHHVYSCKLAKNELGYKPVTSYDKGWAKLISTYKKKDKDVQAKLNSVHEGKTRNIGGKSELSKEVLSLPKAAPNSFCTSLFLGLLAFVCKVLALIFLLELLLPLIFVFGRSVESTYYGRNVFLIFLNSFESKLSFFAYRRIMGVSCSCFVYSSIFFFALGELLSIYANQRTVLCYNSKMPLIGDFLEFSKGPLSFVCKMGNECRGLFSMSLLGKRIIFVSGQEGWEFFFRANDDEVSLIEVYKVTKPIFGKGLIYDAQIEERQQQFHFLAGGLSEHKLKQYVPLMLQECKEYLDKNWKEGVCLDLYNVFAEIISLSATRTLMGKEIRENVYVEVAKLLHTLDEGITYISTVLPYLPIAAHRKRDRARAEMSRIFSKVIASRKQQRKENKAKEDEPADVIDILMNAVLKDGSKFSDDEICGLLICLIFGGQHTSSVVGTWSLINILFHKEEALQHVIPELQQIKDNICYETIVNQTDNLLANVLETLRFHPPLGNVFRYVVRPLYHKGHLIPKGSILAMCLYESGYNDDVFHNSLQYDPKRWIESDWEKWRLMYKYVFFGGGRHTCMGRRFALLQIKTILSYILSNYVLTPLSLKPSINEKGMVVGPAEKMVVQYRKIKDGESIKEAWNI